MKNLFIPDKAGPVNEAVVWRWYLNVSKELEHLSLSSRDKTSFIQYYHEAGLLSGCRQPFFRHHYARTFARAAQFLMEGIKPGRILDLGCGTGTQAIFLALLGGDVVGLDQDEQVLAILRERKILYEKASGKKIKLTAYRTDALTFDYAGIAPIRGIYSMFAFNLIKPSKLLLERIAAHTAEGGRLAILDGNCASWVPRLIPSRRRPGCLTPLEFEALLQDLSFETVRHEGGCALPPLLWSFLPTPLLRPMDDFLGKHWLGAISHQILAEKGKERDF